MPEFVAKAEAEAAAAAAAVSGSASVVGRPAGQLLSRMFSTLSHQLSLVITGRRIYERGRAMMRSRRRSRRTRRHFNARRSPLMDVLLSELWWR